jgi:DHA1 family bicyclomycin/chloramphenicol resistance-like MFS transporter
MLWFRRQARSAGLAPAMLVVLGSLSAFAPLATDMYLPELPAMARGLHASSSAAQLTLSSCLVGLAIGQLLARPVSDAFGRRRPLLAGLACFALASGGCALAPNVAVLAFRSCSRPKCSCLRRYPRDGAAPAACARREAR